MMLPKAERRKLLLLLGKVRHGEFTTADESALRQLIALEFPEQARSYARQGIIQFGWGMASVPYLLKALGDDVDVEV